MKLLFPRSTPTKAGIKIGWGFRWKRAPRTAFSALLAIALAFMAMPVAAQEAGHIELKCVAEMEVREKNEKGEEVIRRVPAARVLPGDTMIYTIQYKVIGADPVDDVVINNPVPENMEYVQGTAMGRDADITFSIDQKVYDKPERLIAMDPNGIERRALPSEYKDIQWRIKRSIMPGETGYVSFRARLK